MDWDYIMKHNHEALLRIVAGLFSMVGMTDGAIVTTLPRFLRVLFLRVLRPAESATRRLIIMATRGLVVKLGIRKSPNSTFPKRIEHKSGSLPQFRLIDPRKQFIEFRRSIKRPRPNCIPQISIPGVTERIGYKPPPPPPTSMDQLDVKNLISRLKIMQNALDDLPAQALRMARYQKRISDRSSPPKKLRLPPLRPGLAPGRNLRRKDEIQQVLRTCHLFADEVLSPPT